VLHFGITIILAVVALHHYARLLEAQCLIADLFRADTMVYAAIKQGRPSIAPLILEASTREVVQYAVERPSVFRTALPTFLYHAQDMGIVTGILDTNNLQKVERLYDKYESYDTVETSIWVRSYRREILDLLRKHHYGSRYKWRPWGAAWRYPWFSPTGDLPTFREIEEEEYVRLPTTPDMRFLGAGFFEYEKNLKELSSSEESYKSLLARYRGKTNVLEQVLSDGFISSPTYALCLGSTNNLRSFDTFRDLARHFMDGFYRAGWKEQRGLMCLETPVDSTSWWGKVYEKRNMKVRVHINSMSNDPDRAHVVMLSFLDCSPSDVFDPVSLYNLTNAVPVYEEFYQIPAVNAVRSRERVGIAH